MVGGRGWPHRGAWQPARAHPTPSWDGGYLSRPSKTALPIPVSAPEKQDCGVLAPACKARRWPHLLGDPWRNEQVCSLDPSGSVQPHRQIDGHQPRSRVDLGGLSKQCGCPGSAPNIRDCVVLLASRFAATMPLGTASSRPSLPGTHPMSLVGACPLPSLLSPAGLMGRILGAGKPGAGWCSSLAESGPDPGVR